LKLLPPVLAKLAQTTPGKPCRQVRKRLAAMMLQASTLFVCNINKLHMLMINPKIDKIISVWSTLLKNDVFYLPVLGPVYASGKSVKIILHDLLENLKTDSFLPYDKNKRWFKRKKEIIILSEVLIKDDQLLIPVESNFPKRALKFFYYGSNKQIAEIVERAKCLINASDKLRHIDNRFLCFSQKPKFSKKVVCRNIYLKLIDNQDRFKQSFHGINFLSDLSVEVRQTFRSLGKEPDLEGFNFLWREFIKEKKALPSIICAVEKDEIVGAIGPLEVLGDAWDNKWLAPPYFGVKKNFRRAGYGERLWGAAMSLAYQGGAKYTLLQSEPSFPSSRFYEKQGLKKEAEVCCVSL